ncbi:MAG: acyl-CoA dehydrogenase [Roseinatronobacter sp.]|nr:acyl-CoA dehydrogenase [Roseinatronobacter sp.]
MPYRAPLQDVTFLLANVVGYDQLHKTPRFAEATAEVTQAILSEAARLCEQVIAPLQRVGDKHPARLENGIVHTPPGFGAAYAQIAAGGWLGLPASVQHGGMGLPQTVATALNEMMSSACLSLQIASLLTQGQIEALEHHASDLLKALYLPKLISGAWAGTMNLTEPQAGSDLAALRSKAAPNGDGSYAVTGQKIYISWGDNDFTENVCHLVLARLPDAPEGTRGISLFLVPKFIPDSAGNPGARNAVRVLSLEHKLGLHGAPTAVMEYSGATGWLVGAAHQGLAAMFTMMNNARVGVGVQGIGVAEAAYQQALAYAQARQQGRTPLSASGPIAQHADVRRMLAHMRAEIFAIRAIALANSVAIDMACATQAPDWAARAALLTPITKAHGTDIGVEAAGVGMQIHGGMGYIEQTGAAQFLRDVRVTTIYEGTNGIQAMDLVGRKMLDGGAAALHLLQEVQDGAEAARAHLPDLAEPVWQAAQTLRAATHWLVAQDMTDRFAGAQPYLRAFARVLGAHYHLRAALADPAARTALAEVFIHRILPEHSGLLAQVQAGAAALYALGDQELMT